METKRYIGEVWKPIRGYVGLYEVSNYGRVKSLARQIWHSYNNSHSQLKERTLKFIKNTQGYYLVGLYKNGKSTMLLVHKIEMEAFIPNPDNLPEVNHKDEDKTNNYIHINPDGTVDPEKSNLEWCTHQYNVNYGTRTQRAADKLSKPILQFSQSGAFMKEYSCIREAGRQTGVNIANISDCCNCKRKTAGTNGIRYIWKYKDAS